VGYGDEIMASGVAEQMFRRRPDRPVAIYDKRNQQRWSELWAHNPAIATIEDVERGLRVQRLTNGEGCRPYISYPFTATSGITFTDWRARDHVGRLYFTDEELAHGRRLRADIGPFVVMEPDVKPLTTPNKAWGLERFAAVVESLADVTFLRMHGPDCQPFPPVKDLQFATFRDACAVLASADGYVGTEGGYHHAAGALRKPGVVIFGGFISPETTGYPWHINLADSGPGSPCGRWKPCDHCTEAMARIQVEDVVVAVRSMLEPQQESACQ
jgi:hypothetical protein